MKKPSPPSAFAVSRLKNATRELTGAAVELKAQLMASVQTCPCGNLGNPCRPCTCTAAAVDRYVKDVDLLKDAIDRIQDEVAYARRSVSPLHLAKSCGELADAIEEALSLMPRR